MAEKFTTETRLLFGPTPSLLARIMVGTLFDHPPRGYNGTPWTVSNNFPRHARTGGRVEVTASQIIMSIGGEKGQRIFHIIEPDFVRLMNTNFSWREWTRTVRTLGATEVRYTSQFGVKMGKTRYVE